MNIVKVISSRGFDWHDYHTFVSYLTEGGGFHIADYKLAIAKNIHKTFVGFAESQLFQHNRRFPSVDSDLKAPDTKEIYNALVQNHLFNRGETIRFDDGQYTAECCFDPKDDVLRVEYFIGNGYEIVDWYHMKEIKADKVCYVVDENFLAPYKGVESICRLLHEPFEDLDDAIAFLGVCERHPVEDGWGLDSIIQLEVFDIDELEAMDWYKEEMKVISLVRNATVMSVNLEWRKDLFRVQTKQHYELLANTIKAANKQDRKRIEDGFKFPFDVDLTDPLPFE